MIRTLFIAVVAAVAPAVWPGEARVTQAPDGTGVIAGRAVTDDATSGAIRRARVTLNCAKPIVARTVVTDDAGGFAFEGLPAGSYLLSATKAALVTTNYGARRPGRPGTSIVLGKGERLTNVALRMPRGAVVEGTIADLNGDPAADRSVLVRQVRTTSGERRLISVTPDIRSDDRGRYRFYGLPPGDYVVYAQPISFSTELVRLVTPADVASAQALARGSVMPPLPAGVTPRPAGFAPIYFPGTPISMDASVLRLAAGDERSGVDFQLALVSMSRVDAIVTRDNGLPANVSVSLSAITATSGGGLGNRGAPQPIMRQVGEPGHYSASAVTPGRYKLTAQGRETGGRGVPAPPPSAGPQPSWYGSTEITVSEADVSLSIRLEIQPKILGRVVFDGASPKPDLSRVMIGFRESATYGLWTNATMSADGTLVVDSMRPGSYYIRGDFQPATPNAAPWVMKSAMLNGRDVADAPFDVQGGQDIADLVVTFTDQHPELSGAVRDASGRPSADGTVIVFPRDRTQWTPQSRGIVTAKPSSDGRYLITSVPSGDYLVVAVSDVENGDWYDVAFLDALVPQATRVTLTTAGKTVVDLTVR